MVDTVPEKIVEVGSVTVIVPVVILVSAELVSVAGPLSSGTCCVVEATVVTVTVVRVKLAGPPR